MNTFTRNCTAVALTAAFLLAGCGSSSTATSASTASTSAASTTATQSTTTVVGDMAGMSHDSSTTAMGDMVGMSHGEPAVGLRIKVVSAPKQSGETLPLSFTINDSSGVVINAYETEQTKELHLVLVRADLSGYQHLHPVPTFIPNRPMPPRGR